MHAVTPPRILCVDDDPSVLDALRRQLRGRYDSVLALGARDGLARLRDAGPFTVILSDLRMPGLDGRGFLIAARAIAPRAVLVLLTGSGDDGADDGLGALVFRRVAKPCHPDVLWASLDAAIAHHALAEQAA